MEFEKEKDERGLSRAAFILRGAVIQIVEVKMGQAAKSEY